MCLPPEYGSWKGVYTRLRNQALDGTWQGIHRLIARADAEGELEWVVAVDSTNVRAHQHAAGARKKGWAPTANWSSTHSDVRVAD